MIKHHIIIPVMGNIDYFTRFLIDSIQNKLEFLYYKENTKNKIIRITENPYIISCSNITFDFSSSYRDVVLSSIDKDKPIVKKALDSGYFTYDEKKRILNLKNPDINITEFNLFTLLPHDIKCKYEKEGFDILITFINIPTYALDFIYNEFENKFVSRNKIIPIWLYCNDSDIPPYTCEHPNYNESKIFQSFEDEKYNPGVYQYTCHLARDPYLDHNNNSTYTNHLKDILICNAKDIPFDVIEDFLVRMITYEVLR